MQLLLFQYDFDGSYESQEALQKIDLLMRYMDHARQHIAEENYAQAIDLLNTIIEVRTN